MSTDLNDSLEGLFGGGPARQLPERFAPQREAIMERSFTEPCTKCRGSGRFYGYSGRDCGPCHACQGRGKKTFTTSPEQRAANRATSAVRRERREAERLAERREWAAAHQDEILWLTAAAERQVEIGQRGGQVWQFPISLHQSLAQYGTLTDGQLAAVRKCMARDAQRREERATAAPAVNASALEEAFNRARGDARADGEGIKMLHLRLDTFVFSPAARHPGTIYVKEDRVYLGKLVNGQFHRSRECTEDQATRIVAAIADPANAARAYGLRTGTCGCCGRELTNRESIDRGIGPICFERFFGG